VRVSSSQPGPSEAQASAPPAGGTRTDSREVLRSLARTLKQVGDVTGSSVSLDRALREAREAEARGDLNTATELMRKALSIAPQDPEIKRSYERLSRELSAKLADEYRVQAVFEAKQGKWAAAALAWSKVCEGRPEDAVAHRQAAFALYKLGGDLRGAQRYAQQAVFLAPDDVDARVLLAQIYLTVGLKLNAKRELDAAAKLDPKNEMVKNLLSDLKG
jgi:tetratricopeptide (TPR) repeat protein